MDLFILLNAHLHFTMRHNIKTKNALQKYMAMRFLVRPKEFAKPRPRNAPPGHFRLVGRKARGTGCSNPLFYLSTDIDNISKALYRKRASASRYGSPF